jgi:hypothetical protein
MIRAQFGLAGDVDASMAHLFKCDAEPLFAVSVDETGSNLPRRSCPVGWQYVEPFALGVHEAMPRALDPEPVLRGLRAVGYYIWREGYRNPSGTTQ